MSNSFFQIESGSEVVSVLLRMMQALSIKTEAELLDILKVSRKTISTWRHRGAVPLDQCDKIARMYHVSLDFILYGIGNPKRDEGTAGGIRLIESDVAQSFSADIEHTCPHCDRFVVVPHYDIEVCSDVKSLSMQKEPVGYLSFCQEWIHRKKLSQESLCTFTICGDSMSPTLDEGELVLIDTRPVGVIRDSGIYMIGDEQGLRIKRLQRQTDGLLIISDNPIYQPELVPISKLPRLQILGRAVWIGKTL